MAFARRGWRAITVGGRAFFWATRPQPAPPPGEARENVRVLVRPADGPHRLLTVLTGREDRRIVIARDVTPGAVRLWVETAAAAGWPDAVPALAVDGVDAAGAIAAGTPRPGR